VTGIDFLDQPINRAMRKAAERGVPAAFLVIDALALKDLPEVFDSVIDSGLLHVFSDEDRQRYVEGLASVLRPGGRLFLLCFSDEEPGTQGPRRVSKKELHDAFAEGWSIESVEVRGPARPQGLVVLRRRAEGVVRGGAACEMSDLLMQQNTAARPG
jgi:cyclopropane fatty-acyl-phospholipid synthase-like methyltransferase